MTEERKETEKESVKIKDYEKEIIEKIKENSEFLWLKEDVFLVDWVWMLPMNPEVSKNIQLWTSLPIVVVAWKKSWRLYFYSLKALLPNIFDEAW